MINRTRYTKLTVPIDIVFLILEDSSLFQMQILIELKKMGFPGATVLVTSSVKEAMTIIETEKIDFIFTDHHLPDGSGIQFIEAVRGMVAHKKTPVIMITKVDDVTNMLDAIDAGASDYMVKPLEQYNFIEKVQSCLRRA